MSWPHCLLHLRYIAMGFEDDNIKWLNSVWVLQKHDKEYKSIKNFRSSFCRFLKYLYFAFSSNFSKMSIVGEGNMVRGMPVETKYGR